MGEKNLITELLLAEGKKARLQAENQILEKSVGNYLAELKARCEKLSIQVNGRHHNAELFGKEIAALTADDLRKKIFSLEWQLAGMQRAGRVPKESTTVESGIPINPKLYKIR